MSAPPRKTYSHLAAARRMPTEYELVTTKLLYYLERGFEVRTPLNAWFARNQTASPLTADWERFADPRETTYTRYVAVQKGKEQYVETLLRMNEERGGDAALAPEWLARLERFWSPFRYAGHGLQMLAAYVGQVAPGARITICCALQAADEIRRIQNIAYRTAQLRLVRSDFAAAAKAVWERDEAWQPLRRVIEQMLVTFDWAEAFTALNLCLKPLVDELLLVDFAEVGQRFGDPLFGAIAFSLREDTRWHRDWSKALVGVALQQRAENADVLRGWVATWRPRAEEAIRALASGMEAPAAAERAAATADEWLGSAGVPR